jgi:hypothetical protein
MILGAVVVLSGRPAARANATRKESICLATGHHTAGGLQGGRMLREARDEAPEERNAKDGVLREGGRS